MQAIKWLENRLLIVEVFVLANISFLAVDIFIAHSVNAFRHPAEWIPFYFSISAPIFLIGELALNWHRKDQRSRFIGLIVGYCSIGVGIGGLLFHLKSGFFEYQTLRSLVYTAPFVAPLAYAGLGFLLILNRMVDPDSSEWGQWIVFLGLGGFVGNFILALCDHAQNGFFVAAEWIPVISSALAVGFLTTALIRKCSSGFFQVCFAVMAMQILVGMLGFYFHGTAVYKGLASSFFENLVHVAPVFAPLLFANLAVLSGFGLWDVQRKLGNVSD